MNSYRSRGVPVYFRAAAAFAMPDVYEYLEGDLTLYAIRIRANTMLECISSTFLHDASGGHRTSPNCHSCAQRLPHSTDCAVPGRAEPSRAGPGRAEPDRAEPISVHKVPVSMRLLRLA